MRQRKAGSCNTRWSREEDEPWKAWKTSVTTHGQEDKESCLCEWWMIKGEGDVGWLMGVKRCEPLDLDSKSISSTRNLSSRDLHKLKLKKKKMG